jgi:hypothetical protein
MRIARRERDCRQKVDRGGLLCAWLRGSELWAKGFEKAEVAVSAKDLPTHRKVLIYQNRGRTR